MNDNITKIVSVTLNILQTILAILLRPFGFIVPKTLEFCLAFQSFTLSVIWWSLLQKHVVCTTFLFGFPIFHFWASPDEAYYRNTSCVLHFCLASQSFTFERHLMKLITETRRVYYIFAWLPNLSFLSVTWWSLLQKCTVRTKLYVYVLIIVKKDKRIRHKLNNLDSLVLLV